MTGNIKIAVIYDWIDKWGGIERVLLVLHKMFPQADFYTSYIDKNKAVWSKEISVKTSFMQNFPDFIKANRVFSVPFYPFAFESFNFDSYDLVISITSSFAKAIITKPSTFHLCYLLTPTRFLWSHLADYLPDNFIKKIANPFINYLRKWDFISGQRPDLIISLSETVKKRCKKYYKRDSDMIYPPFDIEYWNRIKSKVKSQKSKLQIKTQKYYLIVSRLEPYKKVDLAVKVFNEFPDKTLVIVGKGTQEKKLKKIAQKNIQFIPYVSDEDLGYLYSFAEALIMPQEEDFGYVSLEAQFFGCPVISFNRGGATETIVSNKTGLFFSIQTVESLSKTLEQFDKISYNLKTNTQRFGLENIKKFEEKIFVKKFQSIISNIKQN